MAPRFDNGSVFLDGESSERTESESVFTGRSKAYKETLVTLWLKEGEYRNRQRQFDSNDELKIRDIACGSKESMEAWARGYHMDEKQTSAFKCIVSSFIWTWIEEANELGPAPEIGRTGTRHNLQKMKSELKSMKGKPQMIMFMTGPGGSGKSRIINAVVHYAREYVANLGKEHTKNMIVLTALTGVAAVSIGGQTTHTAVRLNADNKNTSTADIEFWKDTRLLIVDEISFGSDRTLEMLNNKLSILKRKGKLYGGVHVLFAGDFRQLKPVNLDIRTLFPNNFHKRTIIVVVVCPLKVQIDWRNYHQQPRHPP